MLCLGVILQVSVSADHDCAGGLSGLKLKALG